MGGAQRRAVRIGKSHAFAQVQAHGKTNREWYRRDKHCSENDAHNSVLGVRQRRERWPTCDLRPAHVVWSGMHAIKPSPTDNAETDLGTLLSLSMKRRGRGAVGWRVCCGPLHALTKKHRCYRFTLCRSIKTSPTTSDKRCAHRPCPGPALVARASGTGAFLMSPWPRFQLHKSRRNSPILQWMEKARIRFQASGSPGKSDSDAKDVRDEGIRRRTGTRVAATTNTPDGGSSRELQEAEGMSHALGHDVRKIARGTGKP